MDVRSVLAVLRAFHDLDGISTLRAIISPLKYPGRWHPIGDIVERSGLSRATVYRVLESLVSRDVVSRRMRLTLEYRLNVWSFELDGVKYEVEIDRVVAYL